jgi:ribosomal protein S18 acetylase RimI-like enzyme
VIEQMGPENVDEVARLHIASITDVLTSLGPRAVRAYYAGCTRTRTAVGLVALEQGAVRGFVLGATHPARMRRHVLRNNRWHILAAMLFGIVTRPRLLALLLKRSTGPEEADHDPGVPQLIYMAIDAASRDSGIGADLVKAFTLDLRGAGASFYEVSVDDDDAEAIGFYEAQGFRLVGRHREFGIERRRYAMRT